MIGGINVGHAFAAPSGERERSYTRAGRRRHRHPKGPEAFVVARGAPPSPSPSQCAASTRSLIRSPAIPPHQFSNPTSRNSHDLASSRASNPPPSIRKSTCPNRQIRLVYSQSLSPFAWLDSVYLFSLHVRFLDFPFHSGLIS